MPLIDQQGQRLLVGMQPVDQHVRHLAERGVRPFIEFLLQEVGEFRQRDADRLDQVRHEPEGVVVVGIDGQPGRRKSVSDQRLAPLRREHGLAVPGGPVDEHQLRPPSGTEPVQDALARHGWAAERRRSESGR